MSSNALINSAHASGNTCLAFSRDGRNIYTGGADALVRIWKTELGTDQEPDAALEAGEAVTTIDAGNNCWLSGSEDADVRKYAKGKPDFEALVTGATGVPIRCVAVDPKGTRVAVSSDETVIKVVDLHDTNKIMLLRGHTKAVRRVSWHPSGSLLTSCGADGKIIVWDVSEDEAKEVKVIEGVIPAVSDSQSPEFSHDCSAIWHVSGQYFFVATRTHEIVTISRSDWTKSSTYSDDASSGPVTAMAMSVNGVYLASASKAGLFIWSTQNRRMMFRYQGALSSPLTQLAWSPSANLLAWTDHDGVLTRWPDLVPSSAPSPTKSTPSAGLATLPKKRQGTPTLFDMDADEDSNTTKQVDLDMDDDIDAGLGGGVDGMDEDWIVDDVGGMDDDPEEKRWTGVGAGVKEMVSVTKAQPAFQPGSTPLESKKRYLAYNMIGVIEVTDQDTHHVVNVEFHDRSARKGYHFTDHFKYDLAALGERGAVYACQPESDHAAHITYKPYGTWASQSEWTYDLPSSTKVLGVAAGGTPPTKSLREKSDADIQGNGNVVIATSDGELVFLTGSGVERYVMSLQGDFVCMVAGSECVFVVTRDGSTSMDGSQNLTGRLIKFDDFCLLQKDALPLAKGHTLKWVGVTEEGAPAIYDSAGVLHALPRFRIPLSATWTRLLNTQTLDRREGKDESYWPVGVSGETFMCLILKGRQEHPSFPRPLIQELPLRLPFKRNYPQGGPSEEHLARESLFLDILRDALGDGLTTDEISHRELALDKEIIQLIQSACKADQLSRAIDLTKLLHHNASFDMAIKVAGFYHLIGLQEKMQALKDDREDADRLVVAREKRRERTRNFAAIPAPRAPIPEPSRRKPFQDFHPPPAIRRPGLDRATPAPAPVKPVVPNRFQVPEPPSFVNDSDDFQSSAADWSTEYSSQTQDGKRKRSVDPDVAPLVENNGVKRRAMEEMPDSRTPQTKSNPFARKPGADNNRNPFARGGETNMPVQKSESFFVKVDAAETEKTKRSSAAKGKGKERKETGRQTTLFGFSGAPQPAEKKGASKKKLNEDSQTTATSSTEETQQETQDTDVTMDESQDQTQLDEEHSQVPTEIDEFASGQDLEGSPEPIEWPASPERETVRLTEDL